MAVATVATAAFVGAQSYFAREAIEQAFNTNLHASKLAACGDVIESGLKSVWSVDRIEALNAYGEEDAKVEFADKVLGNLAEYRLALWKLNIIVPKSQEISEALAATFDYAESIRNGSLQYVVTDPERLRLLSAFGKIQAYCDETVGPSSGAADAA